MYIFFLVCLTSNCMYCILDQRLDLCKASVDDTEPVKGQIIISLLSRDGPCGGTPLAVVGPLGELRGPNDCDNSTSENDELPPGWEERRTDTGRVYYVNHRMRTTQWVRPAYSKNTTNAIVNNPPRRQPILNGDANSNIESNRITEPTNNNVVIDSPEDTPSNIGSPSSSSSTIPPTPVISPCKQTPLSPRSLPAVTPTTAVTIAPNNTSCNVPATNTSVHNSNVLTQSSVQTPRAQPRDRRQSRSVEERRGDGSGRRRTGRNRNSLNAVQMLAAQPQTSSSTPASRLDLPPGYGMFSYQQLDETVFS